MSTRPRLTLAERFWGKVLMNNGCWEWSGSKLPKGYGVITMRLPDGMQEKHYAHRVSYELNVGLIPEGLFVLHTCDNPSCCNPNHLFVGTQLDNMRDAAIKGRLQNQGGARKTHCLRGHPFDEKNTRWRPTGGRACRTCARLTSFLFQRKKRREVIRCD
jgi:hypothetical protein